MPRRRISTGSPFEESGGYSRAIVDGDLCFVAGTTGYDYATMRMPEDIAEQARNCFRTIEDVLREAGFAMTDIVRANYYLTDIKEADKFLEIPVLLRDGELFATALRVAANQAAPAAAREAALITLLNQSGSLWFGPLSAYEGGQACSVAEPSTPPDEVRGATPLPADYLTTASTVIDAAATAGESVVDVRSVALCVKKNLYRRVHYHSTHSPALHPTSW